MSFPIAQRVSTSSTAPWTAASFVAIAGLLAAVTVMALRIYSAVSLNEPLFVMTSGAEEESALALWKYQNGKPVYADPARIPFSASYYNWFFYVLFGEPIRAARAIFGLSDAWTPTLARAVAFCGCLTLLGAVFALLREVGTSPAPSFRDTPFISATFLAMGPLVGFWAISLNPELWATAAQAIGALFFLRLYPRLPGQAILVAALCAYLAWSLKQTHVFLLLAVLFTLVVQRDWTRALALVALVAVAVAVTLAIGTPAFRQSILFKDTAVEFSARTALVNIVNVVSKTLPFTVGLGLGLAALWRHRAWMNALKSSRAFLLAAGGLVASLVLSVPASAKIGASETYYFAPALFAAMLLQTLPSDGDRPAFQSWAVKIRLAAWIVQTLLVLAVLAGHAGVLSVRHWHDVHMARRACLATLPGPLLASLPYLSLPWITPQEPHFVLAYNYYMDRARGRVFEGGGVAGLVTDGYFATLALSSEQSPEIDGATLTRYVRIQENCAGLQIWQRRP